MTSSCLLMLGKNVTQISRHFYFMYLERFAFLMTYTCRVYQTSVCHNFLMNTSNSISGHLTFKYVTCVKYGHQLHQHCQNEPNTSLINAFTILKTLHWYGNPGHQAASRLASERGTRLVNGLVWLGHRYIAVHGAWTINLVLQFRHCL